jgi:hypothetical protein
MRMAYYFATIWLIVIVGFNSWLFGYHHGHKDGYDTAMADVVLRLVDAEKYIFNKMVKKK